MVNGVFKITIKDVAKEAGVSLATVSRVLNNNAKVDEALKQKVLDAASALNYNPNQAARTLSKKKADSIGVIVTNLHSPFYSELVKGFEVGGFESDFNVVFCSALKSNNGQSSRDRYVKFLTTGLVDGVILYGSYLSDSTIVNFLRNRTDIEYLLIENDIQGIECNKFLIDNAKGIDEAISYLIEQGHKNIAYIAGNPNRNVSKDRYIGFITSMQKHNIFIENEYIQFSYTENECKDQINKLLSLPTPPTAILCFDDGYAGKTIEYLMSLNIKVPEDISVIGFDNRLFPYPAYKGPDITTIEQPLFDIGKDSIIQLANKLKKKCKTPIIKTYTTRLIVKESTDVVKKTT